MEPSQLYEEYKAQFVHNCQVLQITSPTEDAKQYSKLIHENNLLLKHISIQLCSLGAKAGSQESAKVNQLKRQIQPFKKKFLQLKKQWESSNRNLLQNTQKISYAQLEQNQKLSQCKQLLYEMEDTSLSIGDNLHSQSQKLKTSTEKVKTIEKVMNVANGLVDKMTSRENRRQNMTYFVVFLVIFIVGAFKVYAY